MSDTPGRPPGVTDLGAGGGLKDFALQGFGLLCLMVAIITWVSVPDERADVAGAASAPVCTAGVTRDCLRAVDGQVTESRHGGRGFTRKYLFESVDGSVRPAWIRLENDEFGEMPPATAELLSGATVTGLYWEGEPAAFSTSRGEVVPIGWEPGSGTSGIWFGLAAFSLGVLGLLFPRNRRPRTARPGPRWLARANAALLGSLLAGCGAGFASSLGRQTLVFVTVGGAIFAVLTLVDAWARRRRS